MVKTVFNKKSLALLTGLVFYSLALPALAYIGPGAGVSFLGSILSTLVVIVLAIGAILFWPLRYLWRRMRAKHKQVEESQPID